MSSVDKSIEIYLKSKLWKYKHSAGQFTVETCPLCADSKSHFYINDITGQYFCWKCEGTGNLYTLKKTLGDIKGVSKAFTDKSKLTDKDYMLLKKQVVGYHNMLVRSKEYKKVLREKWGFTLDAITTFKLGIQNDGDRRWLVVPHFKGGKLCNIKYRTLPPAEKKFKRKKGLDSVLFNIDNLDYSKSYVYVFEGETDTINAAIALKLPNAIGVTVGARSFKEEWIDALDSFAKVYIVYDNDAAGQEGAKKVAFRLGTNRCHNILLPQMDSDEKNKVDLTDWILDGNGSDAFTDLVQNKATQFDVDNVSSLSSVLEGLEAELTFNKTLDSAGLSTQWPKVNELLGSLVPGDLTVLSGPAKIGKTTFALNILMYQCILGIPSLLFCLEMRPERLATKIVSFFRGKARDQIELDDVILTNIKLGRKPLYLGHSYKFTSEQIYETIREATRRYGIELLVFDHLHFLIRGTQNVSAEVSAAVREFKLMAEDLKLPIILICQPRKLKSSNVRMTSNDLRDSSSIGQDADNVIILNRKRLPVESEDPNTAKTGNRAVFLPETDVIVDATRYNPGGIAKLHFNGELSRYFESKKDEREWIKNGKIF
jgi:hypothetical protein